MTVFYDLTLKFPLIMAISVFIMSILNFMLSRVEHEKHSITSGPGYNVVVDTT